MERKSRIVVDMRGVKIRGMDVNLVPAQGEIIMVDIFLDSAR